MIGHMFKALPIATTVLLLLTGCQTGAADAVKSAGNNAPQSSQNCIESEAPARCLLRLVDAELATASDAFTWASAASELAIAYDTLGQVDKSAALIAEALTKNKDVADAKKRGALLIEILAAIAEIQEHPDAASWLGQIEQNVSGLPESSQVNVRAKLLIADAVHKDAKQALTESILLPQDTELSANYKAVTLRKIAGILAKKNDFLSARKAIDAITMSIVYYQSMVRSDVARYAHKAGNVPFANTLLAEAEPIARSQDNGYFRGAALRDIGYSYFKMGKVEKSKPYFKDALAATALAKSPNEQARSTSRIATRLADAGLQAQSLPILNDSIAFAENVKSETTKGYTFYEIAGAASFSGEFELARKLLARVPDSPLLSTSSMHGAAQRDLAWGLARHKQFDEALSLAKSIKSPREKIHALSRIVRLLNGPDMKALPRYL